MASANTASKAATPLSMATIHGYRPCFRSGWRLASYGLAAVEADAVVPEDLLLRRLRDVLAAPELAHGERLAVAVRHVRGEQDLVFADQVDHLRQQRILDLAVDEHPPRLEVLAGGLQRQRGCCVGLLLQGAGDVEAVVQLVRDEVQPEAARLEEPDLQARVAVEHTAGHDGSEAHQHW